MTHTPSRLARLLSRNVTLFYLYSLITNAHFHRGIFVLFLLEKGFSNTEIGLLQGILFGVNFLAEVPTGLLGDRIGRRWSVVIGLGLAALNGAAQLAFGGFWMFAVLFAMHGLSAAFVSGADRALIYDTLKAQGREDEHVRIRGRLMTISGIALAASMAVGGFMQGISWSVVYLAYAGCMALGAIVVGFMVEAPYRDGEAAEDGDSDSSTVSQFFRSSHGRKLVPLMIASGFLHAVITPYFVFSQNVFESKGVTLAAIAVIYSAVQVLGGVVTLLAERVARRISLPTLFAMTTVLVGACAGLTAIAGPWAAVALFFAAMVLPEVAILLVDDHLQERIPSAIRAGALSTFSLVEACFTTVSYLVGGLLLDLWSPSVGLAGLAPMALLSLGAGFYYFGKNGDSTSRQGFVPCPEQNSASAV